MHPIRSDSPKTKIKRKHKNRSHSVHITNEMVADKPAFKDSPEYQKLVDLLNDDTNILVAHNAKFDVDMLIKEGIHPKKVICTLKLARHLDPNGVIPKYKLQYLRYYLGIQIEATAYDALGDILVLEKLLKDYL
jgi:DNA polymerase III epsilon subunit-like protein